MIYPSSSSGTGGTVLVARLSAKSSARSGDEADIWLDASKMHFFDADSGEALTYNRWRLPAREGRRVKN